MEAKETAGLLMTARVARDCSSGLLETTSNRPWSVAKKNTHQLLQKSMEQRKRGEGRIDGGNWKKRERFRSKIEMYVRGSKQYFGSLREQRTKFGALVFANIIKTRVNVSTFFPHLIHFPLILQVHFKQPAKKRCELAALRKKHEQKYTGIYT